MYLPGLPRVSADLSADASSVQLTLTTFMAGLAVGQLLIGPLSDGIAPVVAPLAGGAMVDPIGWRGVLWVLTALAVIMLVGVIFLVPETLPAERRHGSGFGALARNARHVLRNRRFLGYTFAFACGFGALFGYIAQSSFVFQDMLGFSPAMFSVVFATNAVGLVGGNIVNARLIGRWTPRQLLGGGVTALLVASVALTLVVTLGDGMRWAMLVSLFAIVSSIGFVFGNATALAQGEVPDAAGTGSAVLGALQFTVGAVVSPVVGLAGPTSAVPMAVTILTMAVLSALSLRLLTR